MGLILVGMGGGKCSGLGTHYYVSGFEDCYTELYVGSLKSPFWAAVSKNHFEAMGLGVTWYELGCACSTESFR